MTPADCKYILDFCEDRKMVCSFITMNPTYITKNSNTVVKVREDVETIVGFRKIPFAQNNDVNGIEFVELPIDQLCEIKAWGDYADMAALAEHLGIELSEEDKQIIISIDKSNVQIEPETGNYNRFKYITGKAYELLTPEEKAAYDEAKAKHEAEKATKLGKNQAASISFGSNRR